MQNEEGRRQNESGLCSNHIRRHEKSKAPEVLADGHKAHSKTLAREVAALGYYGVID